MRRWLFSQVLWNTITLGGFMIEVRRLLTLSCRLRVSERLYKARFIFNPAIAHLNDGASSKAAFLQPQKAMGVVEQETSDFNSMLA